MKCIVEAVAAGCSVLSVTIEDGAVDDVSGQLADDFAVDFRHPTLRLTYPVQIGPPVAVEGAVLLRCGRSGSSLVLTLRPHGALVRLAFDDVGS